MTGKFVTPEIEVVSSVTEDVITTSVPDFENKNNWTIVPVG